MLFQTQTARISKRQNRRSVIFLLLVLAILIAISACSVPKGSIVIVESPNGTGFTADFKTWSTNNKCELSLRKGDVLQMEVAREEGKVALMVRGKKGSEPYAGNNLERSIHSNRI